MARTGANWSELKDDVAKRGKRKEGKQKQRKPEPRFSAKPADRYDLYQLSVNSAEEYVPFLRKAYRRIRGGDPLHLREEFCGTALLCSEWIRSNRSATAEGYDNDPEPLAWGRERNIAPPPSRTA